jgi:Ferritin-like domain
LPETVEAFDRDGALAEAAHGLALTRRRALELAAGTALGALGGAGAASARSASDEQDDAIINYALGLEYLQASFYTEAERLGALQGPFARQAHVVGAHERAHVAALRKVLGTGAMKQPTFDFHGVTEDQNSFRRTAVAFEDLSVAAYTYEAPQIRSPEYLAAAIGIISVEARHAAWIRRLAGVLPAAAAFDRPLPPHRVNALVASTHFVVAPAQVVSHRPPKFTG